MDRKEEDLKNTILDYLDDYEDQTLSLNKGHSSSAEKDIFDTRLKKIREMKIAFRNITSIEEEN